MPRDTGRGRARRGAAWLTAPGIVVVLALAAASCRQGGDETAGVDPTVPAGEPTGSDAPTTDPERPGGGGVPAFDDATYLHTANLAGSDGASARATVLVDLEGATACLDVEVGAEPTDQPAGAPTGTPTAVHLHRAGADEVVAEAPPPADGASTACVEVGAEVAQEIVAEPAAFSVDVHLDDRPEPALEGRLERAPGSG